MALTVWAIFAQMPKIAQAITNLKRKLQFLQLSQRCLAVVLQLMSIKDIQGLRFTKGGLTFKVSQIKRDYSFANIVMYLDGNAMKEQNTKTAYQQQTSHELPK